MWMAVLRVVMIVAFSGAAAVCDWRSSKIPNWLLICGFITGLLWDRDIAYVLRFLGPVLALYPLYRLRMIGAGDVKLLGVYAGLIGFPHWFLMAGLGLAFAALWSLHRIWSKGLLKGRMERLSAYLTEVRMTGRPQPYFIRGVDPDNAVIPMAVPMFPAVVISMAVRYWEVIMMWISS